MATLSIRLEAKTASGVARVAARSGKSKSEVAREALSRYVEEADKQPAKKPWYKEIEHLIGAVDSGGLQLSERTGEKFTEMLLKERDERRRADRRRTTRRVAR